MTTGWKKLPQLLRRGLGGQVSNRFSGSKNNVVQPSSFRRCFSNSAIKEIEVKEVVIPVPWGHIAGKKLGWLEMRDDVNNWYNFYSQALELFGPF